MTYHNDNYITSMTVIDFNDFIYLHLVSIFNFSDSYRRKTDSI